MKEAQVEYYMKAMKHEIEQLNSAEFIGNIDFKVNIRAGDIANMNIVLSKSVKMPENKQGGM